MGVLPYFQVWQIPVTHQMNWTPKVQKSSESTRVHTEYMHAELTVQKTVGVDAFISAKVHRVEAAMCD